MNTPRSVRVAAALYGWALRVLPAPLRSRYGREMRLDIEALFTERWHRAGPPAVVISLVGALLDLGARALRERTARSRRHQDTHSASQETGERVMNGMRTLRLATRSLLRKPGFAATASLTLGLGLGSVVAIFTLVNAILLQPLPFPDADRIVTVDHHAPGIDLPVLNNSPGTLAMYRDQAPFFRHLAGVDRAQQVLTGFDRPSRIPVLYATHQFLDILGVQMASGRPLTEADDREGAPPVAVITHDFWTGRFGADPAIVGRGIELDGVMTEVVGVLPEGFRYVGTPPDVVAPMGPLDPEDFGSFGITGIARLAPGISLDGARSQLAALQARVPERFPDIEADFLEAAGWSASIKPLKEQVVGDLATTLWLVLGTVGFVLLIACANVANLFLVRAEGRQKEVAVRAREAIPTPLAQWVSQLHRYAKAHQW